jgi:chromosomal replication initiation ATPase DnaA
MRLSINDGCDFQSKSEKATDALLALLIEHHDYSVPYQHVTKAEVIEIKAVAEEPSPVEIGILPIPKATLTIDGIKRVVCLHFGVSHNELMSPRRDAKLARVRQIAMYLAKEFTSKGYPTIGYFFERDHTSVMHGVKKIARQVQMRDSSVLHDVEYLREVLSA